MTVYVRYQCSVCRRTKDIAKDNIRAIPNYCTITKGCEGRLFPTIELPYQEQTEPVADLVDWYPRGREIIDNIIKKDEKPVRLTSSIAGSVVLGILSVPSVIDTLGNQITVKFIQQVSDITKYIQYSYRVTPANDTVISGPDLKGLNLRFNQLVINQNRIFVKVNGVAYFKDDPIRGFTLTVNTVTFNNSLPIGAIVNVVIFQEPEEVESHIVFNKNDSYSDLNPTAWSNVRYVENPNTNFNFDGRARWWLYTTSIDQLKTLVEGANLKIKSISGVFDLGDTLIDNTIRIFLSKPPYTQHDRYINFYVSGELLRNEFAINVIKYNNRKQLVVDLKYLSELYPPYELLLKSKPSDSEIGSSFINPDIEKETNYQLTEYDEIEQDDILKSNIIIGPV